MIEADTRLNTICPYYTMYRLDFARRALRRARHDDVVLDPFCGRGTTNFAARLSGIASIGIDTNPVAVAIAKAKLSSSTPEQIISLCKCILDSRSEPHDVPSGHFWSRCFAQPVLRDICKIRERLLRADETDAVNLLRATLLGILHGPVQQTGGYLSNQMPRTYSTKPRPALNYWRKRDLRPPSRSVIDLVSYRASRTLKNIPEKTPGRILSIDSRRLTRAHIRRPVTRIVTSPPYYGMRSYFPDQWLRNWFLGGPSKVAYDAVDQLPHQSADDFAESLAEVWEAVAGVSAPGAKMLVRFGALPSRDVDPIDLILETFSLADSGWSVRTISAAGSAAHGKRQAVQFNECAGAAIQEIDVMARLRA